MQTQLLLKYPYHAEVVKLEFHQGGNLTSISLKNSIKIYRSETKKSFGQIPNWLLFKMAQRLPATKHHAYCLLAYFLSLKSFTIITPEILAADTGHSERSIYRYLGYLEKIGHVRIIKVRGDDARFITTAYEVYLDKFFWRDNNTDWQKDEIIEYNSQKDIRIEQDANTDWQKDEMIEKKDSSYNKNTRARTRNTENNTDNSKRVVSVLYEKNPRPNRRDFFAAVPAKLRNKKIWTLINSIMAVFKDEAFDFMTGVFCNETINDPIAYLWGAVNRKKADTEKPESLKKETSNENPPPNPQKEPAVKEQPSRAEIQKQNEDIEKSIDDHIESLSHEKRIDLLKEMRIKFNNFQKTRSKIMYRDLERDHDELFKNRFVRQYIYWMVLNL